MDIVYNSGLNMYNLYADCVSSPSYGAGAGSLSRYHTDAGNLFREYGQGNVLQVSSAWEYKCKEFFFRIFDLYEIEVLYHTIVA